MCRRVMSFVGLPVLVVGMPLLLVSQLPATTGSAAPQALLPQTVVTSGQLDLISRQTNDSFRRILKKAYLGYLGLDRTHQRPEPDLFSAETMFVDLNQRLQKEVGPLLKKGKELSRIHLRRVGDWAYLDQFILQELRLKGLMFSNSERYEEARRNLQQAAGLAEEVGDLRALIHILNNLSYCEFHLQEIDEAIRNQQRAVELSQTIGEAETLGLSLYNLGWIHLNSGLLESAVPLLRRAAQSSETAHRPVQQAVALISLGAIQLHRGQLAEAGQSLTRSLKLSREINSLRYRAMSAYNQALVLAGQGQFSASAQLVEEVLSILESYGERVFMRGERELTRRRAAGLLQWLSARAPETIDLASLQPSAAQLSEMPESGGLHSHFSHMVTTFSSSGEVSQISAEAEEPQGKVSVRVTMQEAESHPKGVFSMPVYLKTSEEVSLHRLTLQMTYPKELSFTGAQKGYVLRADEVVVSAETVPHGSDSALRVTSITVNGGQVSGERQSFSDGLVLYLEFKVADRVEERVLTLENRILRAVTVSGQSLPGGELWAEDQTVYLLRPDMIPISPCFFYIH